MITHEKKYYEFETYPNAAVFIKRNLTPSEYLVNRAGYLVLPYMPMECIKNETAAIHFIQKHTNIPTPNIRVAFEDHGRFYLITDYVGPGSVTLGQLPEEKKAEVIEELEGYIKEMHALTSNVMGGLLGPDDPVILPYRIGDTLPEDVAITQRYHKADSSGSQEKKEPFVFCHGDLSQHNVMVDEKTLKITAIIDWEYAGFFPVEFEAPFYLRPGPSVALEGEVDDVPNLLEMLEYWKL